MNRLAAICFDLDDTLWAVGPVLARAEQAMCEWLERRCPRVAASHGPEGLRAERERVAAEHLERRHDLTFLRRQALRNIVTGEGYPPEDAEAAFAVFFRVRNEVEVFADVRPALRRLRGRYRLLSLTNGNADLGLIGLARFFDLSLCAREIGAAKPDRQVFDVLLARAGLAAGQVAYVGDHPLVDVDGARRAGLHAIWMNRLERPWPDGVEPPRHAVRNFGELASLLL